MTGVGFSSGYPKILVDYPDIQQESECIDCELLDDFLALIRSILRPDDDVFDKVDELKSFLLKSKDEIRINLSSASTETNENYQKLVRMLEKQRLSVELMEQIFESIQPGELSPDYTDYFKMLEEYQEASLRYQENYRDHLIHSLRVFLLTISIIKLLGETWIAILKRFLCDSLKGIDSGIDTEGFLKKYSNVALLKLSIEGASVMSFFHDIGQVYSGYNGMIDGLNKRIFPKDKSLFSYKPERKLEDKYTKNKDKILESFGKIIRMIHPEHEELISKFGEIIGRIEVDSSISDGKELHGAIAVLNTYDFDTIRKNLFEIITPTFIEDLRETNAKTQKFIDPEGDSVSLGKDNVQEFYDVTLKGIETRKRKVLSALVLSEAFACILVHELEGFAFLSPFSELLIFADISQEWDRTEFKEGRIEEDMKERIRIYITPCKRTGKLILNFYEEAKFGESNPPGKLIEDYRNKYNTDKRNGVFRFSYQLCATNDTGTEYNTELILICPYLNRNDMKITEKFKKYKKGNPLWNKLHHKCQYSRKVMQ